MSSTSHPARFRLLAAAGAVLVLGLLLILPVRPAHATPSLGALNSQLGQEQAHQHQLSASMASLSQLIGSLTSQISLVQSREAAVRSELASDQAELAKVTVQLKRERARVQMLRRRLARARMLLSDQLVSSYETSRPDLVSVVLNAHGFNDLLEQISFLGRAEHAQQSIIGLTRSAKRQAAQAASLFAHLEARDRQMTESAATRARALAGMNSLLQSRQAALSQARYAQALSLRASQARAQSLQSKISQVRAQQLAAQRAAAQRAAQQAAAQDNAPASPSPSPSSSGSAGAPSAAAPSGGWAIPYSIVLCESGGQNLPPNSAGASGYYQIMPATWKDYGGSGPAAYLAPKSEQDAVASRIWDGGRGASAWVCAGIVGIH
jgi:septal ring factor EnvC (AmiA/AmiB activator)